MVKGAPGPWPQRLGRWGAFCLSIAIILVLASSGRAQSSAPVAPPSAAPPATPASEPRPGGRPPKSPLTVSAEGLPEASPDLERSSSTDKTGDGVRYVLEGVEIRGNTKTRSRVVERYVPFKSGDILDVDDPALTLMRYRLLGTGFFRD